MPCHMIDNTRSCMWSALAFRAIPISWSSLGFSLALFVAFLSGPLRHKAPVSLWHSWVPSGGRQRSPQRSSSNFVPWESHVCCPRLRPRLPSIWVCNTAILSQGLGSSQSRSSGSCLGSVQPGELDRSFRRDLVQPARQVLHRPTMFLGLAAHQLSLLLRCPYLLQAFHLPRFFRGFTGRRQGGAHSNIAATAAVCSVPTHLSRISCTIGSKSRCGLTRLRSGCGESSPIWAVACDCSCDHRCCRVRATMRATGRARLANRRACWAGGSRRASARRFRSLYSVMHCRRRSSCVLTLPGRRPELPTSNFTRPLKTTRDPEWVGASLSSARRCGGQK